MNFAARSAAGGSSSAAARSRRGSDPEQQPSTSGRRPSLYEIAKHHAATDDESRRFWAFMRAWVAMYGAILFWVGAWSFVDGQINGSEFLLWQHIKDTAIGLAILFATDSYYQVGFIPGAMTPMSSWLAPHRTDGACARRLRAVVNQLRIFGSLAGAVFVWNGVYNILYYVFPEDQIQGWLGDETVTAARGIKFSVCIVLGFVLVGASGMLLNVSGVPFNGDLGIVAPEWGSPLRVHAAAFGRATLSTFGQAVVWFGMYEISMTFCPAATLTEDDRCPAIENNMWKAVALMSMGLCGFFVTDAFVSSAFLDDGTEGRAAKASRRTAALYARCVLALTGSMVHNTGVWSILDEKLYASMWRDCSWEGTTYNENWPCWARNLMFAVAGYGVMLGTRSAAGNAGAISRGGEGPIDYTPSPMLHVMTARTSLGQRHQDDKKVPSGSVSAPSSQSKDSGGGGDAAAAKVPQPAPELEPEPEPQPQPEPGPRRPGASAESLATPLLGDASVEVGGSG